MNRTLVALLLVAFPLLSAGQSDARIPRPEIRVGDSWTYRSTNILEPGTHEHETRVSFADDKVILAVSTRKSDGKEFDSAWTSEWNAVTSYTGLLYRPRTGALRFPMHVGDKYSFKFEVLPVRAAKAHNNVAGTAAVVGWETVEVPAGKFRAMRVDVEAIYQRTDGSGSSPMQGSLWYVPEVRRWVKLQSVTPGRSLSEELLAYKLNED